MKNILIILFALLPFFGISQTKEKTETMGTEQDEMEAMGLKQYIFVMYTKGDNRTHDSATVAKIQTQHVLHLDSLAEIGVLNVAGPFLDEYIWRGILIFDVKTKEEAESYVKKDPAVISGRLNYVILSWMTKQGISFK